MSFINRIFFFYLVLFAPTIIWGQGIFRLYDDKPQSFKFELSNNIVLIPVTINGIQFNFLLDTGIKETLLFAETEDSLYLHNQNRIVFQGLGRDEGIEGILSTGNRVEIADVAVDTSHWLYVIRGSELDISSNAGVIINGIMGSKFFNSFPVVMDYIKSKITLFPPDYDYRRIVRRHSEVPVTIENERPYMNAGIQIDKDWINGKMLIDMGNTDPFMLLPFLDPDVYIKPPFVYEYIGRGINGIIYGKRNRVRKAHFSNFELPYPIVSYPDSAFVYKARFANNRLGSIGNQTLKRFHILIDYAHGKFYFKRNHNFKNPFVLNMAGIDIKHDGMIWEKEYKRKKSESESTTHGLNLSNEGVKIDFDSSPLSFHFVLKPVYKISGLRKDSPAEKVGVKVDDIVLKINGVDAGKLTMDKIMKKFQSKPNDQIRLTIQRDDQIKTVTFRLVDPIPF